MPELRKDPIVDRWVIFSEARTLRPSDYPEVSPVTPKGRESCPFCPGHESHTPPEVLAYRDPAGPPNGAGWSTRVIPNKFPALTIEGARSKGDGIYD
jgi:UDPglucose--hexose-1-phosphate uridylyltransferase